MGPLLHQRLTDSVLHDSRMIFRVWTTAYTTRILSYEVYTNALETSYLLYLNALVASRQDVAFLSARLSQNAVLQYHTFLDILAAGCTAKASCWELYTNAKRRLYPLYSNALVAA
jgi:hypothetical protein